MTSKTEPHVGEVHAGSTTGAPTRLYGNMSTAKLVFIVLAFNAPLGLVAGIIPLSIAFGPGLGAPYLFLGFGALLAVFAVGYGLVSRTLTGSGAYYTFVTAGLGKVPGLAASFLALLTYACGIMSILVFAGLSGESLLVTMGGPQISWWIWSLAIGAGVGVLGFFRVDFSTKVLAILVICEVGIVVLYNIAVTVQGGATGELAFNSFSPSSLTHGGVAIGLVFAVLAFGGFESTAIFRNEVRDPARTVPRATYISIGLISVFYCLTSWVMIQAYGENDAVLGIMSDPTGAFLGTMYEFLGRVVFDIAAVLVITSSFASVTAMHNVMTRYMFNLGSDGVFPKALGRPHPRLNSPHRSSIIFTVITLAVIALCAASTAPAADIYSTIAGISGFSLACLLFLASIGIPAFLLRNKPVGSNVWQNTIAPLAAAVALGILLIVVVVNIDLLTGSPNRSYVAFGLVLAFLIVGAALALILRATRPGVYEKIGASS